METMPQRLRALRTGRNLTQKSVADSVGVAQSTYTLYETGNREPALDVICKLASFFNTTVDYLLGLSDVKEPAGLTLVSETFASLEKDIQKLPPKQGEAIADGLFLILHCAENNNLSGFIVENFLKVLGGYAQIIDSFDDGVQSFVDELDEFAESHQSWYNEEDGDGYDSTDDIEQFKDELITSKKDEFIGIATSEERELNRTVMALTDSLIKMFETLCEEYMSEAKPRYR